MITITALRLGIDPSSFEADLILRSPRDYAAGYREIIRAIYAGKELQVLVVDSQVSGWIRILAQRYGPSRVSYKELTVHKSLEERIGLPVPTEITERDILDSGLLELNIPATDQESFQEYLLEVFFGKFMTRPESVYRVNEILADYEPEQWQQALKRPLVRKIYADWFRQKRSVLEKVADRAELRLLAWLEKSPETYLHNLAALKLLSNYPASLGERVLGNEYGELSKLGLDLRRIPIRIQDNQAAIDEIRIYLNQVAEKRDSETFETLLAQVSGWLEIELEAITVLLKLGVVAVDKAVILRVQHRFAALQEHPHIAQALSDLNLLVVVEPPKRPHPDWDATAWIQWAAHDYLPYRFWLEDTSQLNDQIGDMAGDYADWLYQNYGSLRYNSENMAWRAMLSIGEIIKSHAGPVLVVMVDNFNLKFYPFLQRQLQRVGFFEQEFRYCFSMLPSFTEISKKCIIAGDYKPFSKELSYATVVESSWTKRLGRKTRYLANIVELRRVTERTHEVYFLNYLPIDFTLHQQDSHTGIPHAQTVQIYLETLAHDIQAFARQLLAERDLMVVFIADHGSTRIPRGTVNVIDQPLYRKHALDEHHRFISITKEEAAKLPDKVKYECYLFDSKEFDLPESYLVAKRLYRFRPTDDSVYTHGGLTPEETIIPIAIFRPIAIVPRPLEVRLIEPKKIMIGTRTDLVFEITNHNNQLVEHIEFEVSDPNVESLLFEVGDIQKLERTAFRLSSRSSSNADISATKLRIKITYQFLGQLNEQITEVPVVYDSLLKLKFDFKNL